MTGPADTPARTTILVVDDDRRNRQLARAYLERLYEVVEAEDGASALEVLGSQSIDLVLLDVMMPGMSGFECCREIKKRHSEPYLPVILLTALSEREDRHRGLEAGADDFLGKPMDTHELMLRVRTFLRLRAQDVELRRREATIRSQLEDLRELDGLKDDLVSLLVHDLRNPLTGILGFLTIMREDTQDVAMQDDLDRAVQATVKLRETIEDLLQVRLLEEGRIHLDAQPHSVRALVSDALTTVAGAAEERHIALRLKVDEDVAMIFDLKLVRRAIENILINALKYSPRGAPVEISVNTPDQGVAIEISDRGPGIPDAYKSDLFEKFARVGKQDSARTGFGLGLYLVKLVASAHGGHASVRDREGGGSTFELFLPLPPAPIAARA